MTYDDTPYWQTGNSEQKVSSKPDAPKMPVIKRSIPLATQVLSEIEKTPRAKFVSPLLAEWLSSQPGRQVSDILVPKKWGSKE